MGNQLSFVLLLPLILWSSLQFVLYFHSTQVEESLQLAIFEGQKEAALQGHYDGDIYRDMREYLVDVHGYESSNIVINGTESPTPRGERLEVSVTIPQPVTHVMDLFRFNQFNETLTIEKTIMSEYNPA